jgi:magnesium-transporting ATPase (P-type)
VTKGAVDSLLDQTKDVWVEGRTETFDESRRERIMAANDRLAGDGMRVLGWSAHAG